MCKYKIGDHVSIGAFQKGIIEDTINIVGDVYYPNGLYSIKTYDGKQLFIEEDLLDSLNTKSVETIGQIPLEDFQSIIEENYR